MSIMKISQFGRGVSVRILTKAKCLPSGAGKGAQLVPASLVICLRSEPSRFTVKICMGIMRCAWSSRFHARVRMVLESGMNCAPPSCHSSVKVICFGSVPSDFMTHRSILPSMSWPNRIHLPSGETAASAS